MNKKDIFGKETGIFKNNEKMDTQKKAFVNAKDSNPRLEYAGKSKLLSNKAFAIGRDKSNQIIIADPKVSRFHAIITFENDEAFIKDTDSSNGTFVNEKMLTSGKKNKLKNGDKIKIGTTVLIFYR